MKIKKLIAFKIVCLSFLLLFLITPSLVFGQSDQSLNETMAQTQESKFQIGINGGFDLPFFSNSFKYYSVKPSFKAGMTANYFFGKIGIGIDYDYLKNKSGSSINDVIYYDTMLVSSVSKTDLSQSITRHFIGIGPSYRTSIGQKLDLMFYLRGGYSLFSGGEAITTSGQPGMPTSIDHHMLFTGVEGGSLAGKVGLNIGYRISSSLSLELGTYYLHHFSVHLDDSFELNNNGSIGIFYGHSDFEEFGSDQALTGSSAHTIPITNVEEPSACAAYSSVGLTLGLKYSLGPRAPKAKEKIEICSDCECPNDGHKVMVTVRDELSKKIIPNSDVLVRDEKGGVIATGTTNSFGIVDLGELPHGNYKVEGLVYGIATTIAEINESEFSPAAVIRKEVLYTDLRFILKGVVVNKNTRAKEPNVLVNLTNTGTNNVEQTTSGRDGGFAFRLDKSSSYKVVGIKENRLSDEARASTMGLNRSTTLFVDLELGVEDFGCDRGTVLDIKYEFDKDNLLPESKYDLDKLVRYMKAHDVARVELSSHTDARGSNDYNQDLSQRRAQSAVNYIKSKGINQSRIVGNGYGETRLKNRCADGVNCSEAEHRINRRTEAKLLCN